MVLCSVVFFFPLNSIYLNINLWIPQPSEYQTANRCPGHSPFSFWSTSLDFFFYVVQGFSRTNSENHFPHISINANRWKLQCSSGWGQKCELKRGSPKYMMSLCYEYLYQNRCMVYILKSKRQVFSWLFELEGVFGP